MRARSSSLRIVMIGMAAALAAVGCGNDHGSFGPPPDVPFSPPDVANSIHSLRFAPDNVALAQVGLITDALGLTTPGFSAAPRQYERGEAQKFEMMHSFAPTKISALVKKRAIRLSQGAKAVPLFPINFLGETFAYDAGFDGYVISGQGGGPANGVRFILYRLDGATGLPSFPLAPFGFVDLFDESDAVSTILRVSAWDTAGGSALPLGEYTIDGAFASVSSGVIVNLLSDGFVVDHNGRFDFQLDETLETDDFAGVTLASVTHRVISDEGSTTVLTVDGEIANDGSFSDLAFGWDIAGSAGATSADLRIIDGFQEGTISHGGRTEVFVSGSVQLPDYVRPNGSGFGPNDTAALDEILFGIDDVLILADEVLRPLGEIFGVR